MKCIFLLTIFAIVQYGVVKGYPQYNNAEKNLPTIVQERSIDKSINDSLELSSLGNISKIMPYLTKLFKDSFAYFKKKLDVLEKGYNELSKHLKNFIKGSKNKINKEPSIEVNSSDMNPSNVSNEAQEVLTTPTPNTTTDISTPDKSTNTQKPAPAKHDDKNKPDDEKDPLHTSETILNETQNTTPIEDVTENIKQTVSESTDIQKPIKNDKEELIKNDKEELIKNDKEELIKNDKEELIKNDKEEKPAEQNDDKEEKPAEQNDDKEEKPDEQNDDKEDKSAEEENTSAPKLDKDVDSLI